MKRLISLIALAALLCVAGLIIISLQRDNRRLEQNLRALDESVTLYRTRADKSAASVRALEFTIAEFKELRRRDAEQIRDLGIRLRRAESYARSISRTTVRDTILLRDTVTLRDTVRVFESTSPWHSLYGILRHDTMSYILQSIDTLHQVVHRVPRRFLFFRYGTKAIRQEVWSSNPNTTLIYSEYIELKR